MTKGEKLEILLVALDLMTASSLFGARDLCEACPSKDVRRWHRAGRGCPLVSNFHVALLIAPPHIPTRVRGVCADKCMSRGVLRGVKQAWS
jgi:hypothetical protein